MEIYTRKDWEKDRSFSAKEGQEIEEDIYETMYNCLPPIRLPKRKETEGYESGFLMGEPHSFNKQGEDLYLAFGKKENKCYYIGKIPKTSEWIKMSDERKIYLCRKMYEFIKERSLNEEQFRETLISLGMKESEIRGIEEKGFII